MATVLDSVTIECGPTNATITDFNSTTLTAAYACGKQQERYTSGTVRSIKLRSTYTILLLVFILQVVSCNTVDLTNEMLQLITTYNEYH